MSLNSEKMVNSNKGIPDPGNPNDSHEELSPNVDVIIGNGHLDSDTDDDENAYSGYEPLPMHDFHEIPHSDEDSGSNEVSESACTNEDSLPPITRIEDVLVKDVWSGPSPKEVDIEMDPNKVDEVKQVMLNITLPPSSIPDWATNIPEDEWKQQLMSRLQGMHKSGTQ